MFNFFLLRHQNPDVSGQNASSVPMHRNRNQGALWSLSGVETPFRLRSMNVSNKKIFPCRCLVFAAWLYTIHMAKPKRLHKPMLKIFLHSTAKIASLSEGLTSKNFTAKANDIHKICQKISLFFCGWRVTS